MNADPTLALSFAAGVLSFLSPCIVPLVPSYLSFIGGVAANEAGETGTSRGVVILRTALFVVGFTIVFVVLGVVFSGSGALFTSTGRTVNIVAGAIVIALGLNVIFDFWKFLNIERRYHLAHRPSGHLGSVLIGMAFGAGWTPCIGPILASVLLLAGSSGSVTTGVVYLTAFSLGLGVPFLLAGIFFGRATEALRRMRRYLPAIKIASGVLLIAMGVLIAVGRLQQLSARLIAWGARLEAWDATNPAASDWSFAIAVALAAGVPLTIALARRSRTAVLVAAATLSVVGLALAALNVTGIVSIAGWFSGWFRYTGL